MASASTRSGSTWSACCTRAPADSPSSTSGEWASHAAGPYAFSRLGRGDRIRAAIVNSGEEWPQRRITVGLSPASLPKRGSWFDLAIAIGLLTAAGTVPRAASDGVMFFGELGLDGQLRPVPGVLPAVAAAAPKGFGTVMVAEQNAPEAALVPGVRVIAASSLAAAADWLRGTPGLRSGPPAAEFKGGRDLPGGQAAD